MYAQKLNGAGHTFLNGRMPGAIWIQSHHRLRHANHGAGRRSARHRLDLGTARPSCRVPASSRHHAYLPWRALHGSAGHWRRLALASLAHSRHEQRCMRRRRFAIDAAATCATRALGLDLAHCPHRGLEPPATRLDQQLRPAPVLPLQRALVRGQHLLYLRTRVLCRTLPSIAHARHTWLWPTRRLEFGPRCFEAAGWAIFALAVGVVLGCWRWAEHDHALESSPNRTFKTSRC